MQSRCTTVPLAEQMQIRYTHAKSGVQSSRRVEIKQIRSTILSRFTAANRWTTAMPVNMEGDDANQFALRSGIVAECVRHGECGILAGDEPGIQRGRGAAAL